MYAAIGICITFTADSISIFIGIAFYAPIRSLPARPTYNESHAADFLKTNNLKLKEISDKWMQELDQEQECNLRRRTATDAVTNGHPAVINGRFSGLVFE